MVNMKKFNQIKEWFAWYNHIRDMRNAIKNIWGEMMNEEW